MLKIYPVKTNNGIEIAKVLFSESNSFAQGILSEYDDFPWAVKYWQSREEDVSELPGKYGHPRACILIAEYKDKSAGCVGLLEENLEVSIMTYLYVREEFRGLGIGKSLVKTIIKHANNAGYNRMCLHTNLLLTPAINLYKSLGFNEVSQNRDYPAEIKDLIVDMELEL